MGVAIEPMIGTSERSDEGVRLESLPKELGVLMLLIGIGGILLPGPVGSPFLVFGGVVLFPELFRKMDRSLQERFPAVHRQGMKQVHRFVLDIEKRYPTRA